MGLSRIDEPLVTTYQVIIELARGLKALADDPKALEKAAKDAYALPEEEQRKADEARQKIAEYTTLLSQNKTKIAEYESLIKHNDEQIDYLEQQQKSLKDQQDKLTATEVSIDKKTRSLNEREAAFAQVIEQRTKAMDDAMAKTEEERLLVIKSRKEADAALEEIKQTQKKIRELAGGL